MSQINELKVKKEYFDLVPRPTEDQFQALKESIQKEGQLEPIIVDENGVIIDGHTRFEICKELEIEPKYIIKKFDDEQIKENFIITVNLKRRHLNDFQIYELFEKQIELIRKKNVMERNQRIWDVKKGRTPISTYEQKVKNSTLGQASELTGLGRKNVELCMFIKKHGDKKIISELREGKTSPTKAHQNIKQKIPHIRQNRRKLSRMGWVANICDILLNEKNLLFSDFDKTQFNYYQLKDSLKLLARDKLIQKKTIEKKWKEYDKITKRDVYNITVKGKRFLVEYKKLEKLIPKEMRL